jgi:predicted dehydrogenase
MAQGLSRRDMVRGGGVGLAGLIAAAADEPPALLGAVKDGRVSLPPLHAASEQNDSIENRDAPGRRLGVAVAGLGHLALAQILPGFGQARHVRLAALVSGEADKARAVAAQHGLPDKAVYGYADFDRLRDDPDVDVVYIALPNAMHAEYVVRAAQAGKHVLCEKPMATSVADAEHMVAACRDAGRRLMIAYRCQYEPYNKALTSLVRSGELGRIRLIQAVNGQNDLPDGQWRQSKAMAGGGSLPDVGLYCLNAARCLTGEEPVEISARMTQPKDDPRFREIEDVVAFTLRFPSGAVADCASGYSLHESRRVRVMCETGWAELDPAFAYGNLDMRVGRKVGEASAVESRKFVERNQFALEMDHFAQAIRAGKEPRTPGEEGLQDQRLIASIYEAAQGGGVVKLPEMRGTDATRGPDPATYGEPA